MEGKAIILKKTEIRNKRQTVTSIELNRISEDQALSDPVNHIKMDRNYIGP